MAKLSPRSLAAAFGAYFVLIFLLAWYFSKDLATAWYQAEISQLVYFANIIAGALVVAGMAAGMLVRATSIERRIDAVEDAVGAPRPRAVRAGAPEAPVKDHVDRDIDDLLESLSEMEATTQQAEMEEVVEAEPQPIAPLTIQEASVARARLEMKRRSVRAYLTGPAVVGAVFLGISGAMLPGAGGFLQTYHQLNTTLILGMAYGWIGLGGYVISSVSAHLKVS
jgi:hypothetical protein